MFRREAPGEGHGRGGFSPTGSETVGRIFPQQEVTCGYEFGRENPIGLLRAVVNDSGGFRRGGAW